MYTARERNCVGHKCFICQESFKPKDIVDVVVVDTQGEIKKAEDGKTYIAFVGQLHEICKSKNYYYPR